VCECVCNSCFISKQQKFVCVCISVILCVRFVILCVCCANIFLENSSNHRGYKCYELSSCKIIISLGMFILRKLRSFSTMNTLTTTNYNFLDNGINPFLTSQVYTTSPPTSSSNITIRDCLILLLELRTGLTGSQKVTGLDCKHLFGLQFNLTVQAYVCLKLTKEINIFWICSFFIKKKRIHFKD
jgi:hypothetical protein